MMKKFLATFAAYTGITKATNKGPNDLIPFTVEHTMTAQALAASDTLDLSVPLGYEDYVPQLVAVFSNASPRVSSLANLAITNHNPTTGVTRLTATGTVPQNSTISLAYYPSTKI